MTPTSLGPAWSRVRFVANAINGSTLAGVLYAAAWRVRLTPGAELTLVGAGAPRGITRAGTSTITIGNVILSKLTPDRLAARPELMRHERRHVTQWALCAGLIGYPVLYLAASAYSQLRDGNPATANAFEIDAGLEAGGYRRPTVGRPRAPRPA